MEEEEENFFLLLLSLWGSYFEPPVLALVHSIDWSLQILLPKLQDQTVFSYVQETLEMEDQDVLKRSLKSYR